MDLVSLAKSCVRLPLEGLVTWKVTVLRNYTIGESKGEGPWAGFKPGAIILPF